MENMMETIKDARSVWEMEKTPDVDKNNRGKEWRKAVSEYGPSVIIKAYKEYCDYFKTTGIDMLKRKSPEDFAKEWNKIVS